MLTYRPDRVVRVLTALTTFAYFALLGLGVIVLIGVPTLKLLAGDSSDWSVGLRVPVEPDVTEATVLTRWGDARLEIEDMQGSLRLPVGMVPWGFFALVWVYVAAAIALILSFLYHLRRIFMRVRDGKPFDALNVVRLRWLGLIALGMALLSGVSGLIGVAVSGQVVGDGPRITAGLPIDGSMVFLGLVLLALAEIFRRGAELEHEQSLTVQPMHIEVTLEHTLERRGMTLTELSERVGMTLANLSILKTNKAKAIRFSTLSALCRELDCQPGDLLVYVDEE